MLAKTQRKVRQAKKRLRELVDFFQSYIWRHPIVLAELPGGSPDGEVN